MDVKQFASLGGKARAKKLSKKRRSEIAKKAIAARWAKKVDQGADLNAIT